MSGLCSLGGLCGGQFRGLFTRGLLSGGNNRHGLIHGDLVEAALEIDGDIVHLHAEQVVRLVFKGKRDKVELRNRGNMCFGLHAMHTIVMHRIALIGSFLIGIHQIDAFFAINAKHLHETRMRFMLALCDAEDIVNRNIFEMLSHLHCP